MSYATPADLARVATRGWDDLAQRVVQNARLSGEVLRGLYMGEDMSATAPEVLDMAQRCLDQLGDVLERASRHADTYIQPRYQGQLPLPAHLVSGSALRLSIPPTRDCGARAGITRPCAPRPLPRTSSPVRSSPPWGSSPSPRG